ncbi:MAG: alpha/beta hydrolase [Desulfobulbaceae bacterium]|nr:alpha/beta hydrolase [Desulfobulbaceae bacterium]
MDNTLFLHGLDSSSHGYKGRYFAEHFPGMVIPDFVGDLSKRLGDLEKVCHGGEDFVLVGSSFGGLMATCFAISNPARVKKLILLAPALNFPGFAVPEQKILTPTEVIIGDLDTITPPDKVIPLARQTFENLKISRFDDDHFLHKAFGTLNWRDLLQKSG